GRFHARKSSNPPPTPTDFPTYGAVVKRLRPAGRFPHAAVHVNAPMFVPELPSPGQFGGFLGRGYDPLVIGEVTEDRKAIRGLEPLPDLPVVRLESRRSLLQNLGHYRAQLDRQRGLLDMNTWYRQAYEFLSAPQSRQAFDLSREPMAIRERYG